MSNDWIDTTIGQFCPFEYGKGLPERKRRPGPYPVFGSNGQVGWHVEPLVYGPGIIIGRKGTVGAVHFSQEPFWPIDTTFYVAEADHRDLRFTYYMLSSLGLYQMNADSAVPGLNREAAHARRIRVPPLPEQRAIAHILGTLDDKIELNRRMNETLEAMAQALFKSWFVDFDPVVVNALRAGNPIHERFADRAAHYRDNPDRLGLPEEILRLFPARFVDSELGPIPEGWEVKAIGEVVKCVGGATPSTKNPEYWESGSNPFLTPKDMASLDVPVVLDTERHITDAGVARISSGRLPVGTVLLSSRAPIGYLAINEVPVSVNQGIIAMICDGDVPNYYVYFWVKNNMGMIKGKAGGTTFAEISKRNFRPIPMLVPSIALLERFRSIAESAFTMILENAKSCRTLATLRDTLLPKLISGELRVPDVEMFLKERCL